MTKWYHLLAVAGVASLFAGCAAPMGGTREPPNLSFAKQAVIAYHDSGDYERDLRAAAAPALAWLERRAAAKKPGERLAIVFDIDETMLSSYDHMRSQDFGYVGDPWSAFVNAADGKVIAPVKAIYEAAHRLGVTVFYITGRKDPRDRTGTERNLREQGVGDYERLYLSEAGDRRGAVERKSEQRRAIEAAGYVIVANVGDQQSDLEGGHAERTFKLPNPFYHVP